MEAELRGILAGVDVRKPALPGSSIDECVEQLLPILPPRFALAGLSLGGIVAMALVRQAPERVSRLCLMSTNPYGPTPAQLASWVETSDVLRAGGSARGIQQSLMPVLLSERTRPHLEAGALAMAEEVGEQALINQLSMQATRIDERDALGRVGVPTLILAAEEDALCPVSKHQEMHTLIKDSRLVLLSSAGHLSPLERPRAVAEELARWLQ